MNDDKNINDFEFWQKLTSNTDNLIEMKNKIEYLLREFGTREPCNRFDIGNSIEFILNDCIKCAGFSITELPNAKRVDVDVNHYKSLSIKYSSIGDITLHNSNSTINTDILFKDTLLLTLDGLYLITNEELIKKNINIQDYLVNAGDSLKLKRKILTTLNKDYPYKYPINILHDKIACKNRLTSKVFYKQFLQEYNNYQQPN